MKLRRTFGRLAGASIGVTLLGGIAPAYATPSVITASGPLSDLSAAANATDGVQARVYAIAPGDGKTQMILVLTGLDPASAGQTYGVHVHVGPCVAGGGSAALGHYNTGAGSIPSPQNEVWLDFTVRPGGVAVSRTTTPFEIGPGTAQSVVVHANPTQPGTGVAGGRIACLPVQF